MKNVNGKTKFQIQNIGKLFEFCVLSFRFSLCDFRSDSIVSTWRWARFDTILKPSAEGDEEILVERRSR
jgi:hypothetical protein